MKKVILYTCMYVSHEEVKLLKLRLKNFKYVFTSCKQKQF